MRWLAVGVCAVAAAAARADPQTGLFEWQVSADGGTTWSSSIIVDPGAPYQIRGRASWTTVPGTLDVGFAVAAFNQIDLIGADSSDTFGGASSPGDVPVFTARQQGPAQHWSLQEGTGASAGGLKLDATDPAREVYFGQLPVMTVEWRNPDFRRDNPLVVFLMDCSAGGGGREVTISSPWLRRGPDFTAEFKIYTTETGTNKRPVNEAVMTDAIIAIIPSPGPLSVLATAALLRRRTRGAHP